MKEITLSHTELFLNYSNRDDMVSLQGETICVGNANGNHTSYEQIFILWIVQTGARGLKTQK